MAIGIDQRIPDLSDKALEQLHANAIRLVQSGSADQRRQAEALLPLLEAALEARHLARVAAKVGARRTKVQRDAIISEGISTEEKDG